MDTTIIVAIVAVAAILIGIFLGKQLFAKNTQQLVKDAEEQAAKTIENAKTIAETLKEKKLLEAKEHFLQLKTEQEKEANQRVQKIAESENKIKQQQQSLNDKTAAFQKNVNEVEQQKEHLNKQLEAVNIKRAELEKHQEEHVKRLEKVANLSAEEAKSELMEAVKEEARTNAMSYVKEIMEEAKLNASKEAKKIVIQTIQRTAAEQTIENAITVFNLESDEIKGQIIGREGRNIRALEAATGVDLIIDDTPEAIILSCFDPLRREIARLSLQRLVQDGRIHPARIEEVVNKTRKNIDDEIIEIGEKTVIDLGIHGLHPELIKMIGRMRFRSSYGQNLLQHSREVAKLCATMAAELGLNAKLAKRAGLLHDIGKVWHEEPELPHALLGMELAQKYKEHPEVCNAIGAHHDECEMTSMISPIIQVCDAISGSRPGARREMMESYMKRLRDLETLATSFDGVQKCYAIQAGRELRIMVDSENVSDEKASNLSFDISQKIEKEMQYPGQIKVTVIREMRAVNFAK